MHNRIGVIEQLDVHLRPQADQFNNYFNVVMIVGGVMAMFSSRMPKPQLRGPGGDLVDIKVGDNIRFVTKHTVSSHGILWLNWSASHFRFRRETQVHFTGHNHILDTPLVKAAAFRPSYGKAKAKPKAAAKRSYVVLSTEQRRAVRTLVNMEAATYQQIADVFGVSRGTIANIASGV